MSDEHRTIQKLRTRRPVCGPAFVLSHSGNVLHIDVPRQADGVAREYHFLGVTDHEPRHHSRMCAAYAEKSQDPLISAVPSAQGADDEGRKDCRRFEHRTFNIYQRSSGASAEPRRLLDLPRDGVLGQWTAPPTTCQPAAPLPSTPHQGSTL